MKSLPTVDESLRKCRRYERVCYVALAIIIVNAALMIFAAQDRTPPSPIRVQAITMEPETAPNGALISLKVTAHMQRVEVMPNNEAHVKTLGSVQFNLVTDVGEVGVSGNKRAYNAVGHAIYQIAMQEWADTMIHGTGDPQPPSALPESRVRRVK